MLGALTRRVCWPGPALGQGPPGVGAAGPPLLGAAAAAGRARARPRGGAEPDLARRLRPVYIGSISVFGGAGLGLVLRLKIWLRSKQWPCLASCPPKPPAPILQSCRKLCWVGGYKGRASGGTRRLVCLNTDRLGQRGL